MERRSVFNIVRAAIIAAALGHAAASFAQSPKDMATYKGPDRQRLLEEGARKEGKVVLYSGVSLALPPLIAAFQKRYPFLELQTWTAPASEILTKVLLERRAKNQVADIVDLGSGTLAAIQEGAVAPFHSESLIDFPPQFYDPKGYWAASRVSYFGLAYNTTLITAAQAPKTWDDLLDPRWKGKMAIPTNADTGSTLFVTNLRLAMGDEQAEQYLQKLATQNPTNFSMASALALVGLVGQGEYPMALHVFANNPIQAAQKGATVDIQMIGPVAVNFNTAQLVADSPHPYAAMLLMDFFLSAEGQGAMRDVGYFSANRRVDPLPEFRRIVPALNKMKENVVTPEMVRDMSPKSMELFRKYFR